MGAKTIELIHQNVHVDAVRDDLDTLVLDADLLEAVLSNPDPKKAKEIEIKLKRRLRGHGGNPKFKKLSERLDALKDRFESGQVSSVEFLKQLLEIAKETLQAEKEAPPEEDEDRGKAALTELFNEVKTSETPIMVERVVADIDEIVRLVRFPGWQGTQPYLNTSYMRMKICSKSLIPTFACTIEHPRKLKFPSDKYLGQINLQVVSSTFCLRKFTNPRKSN